MRSTGDLPGDLIIKTSVMMAPANPASARILEDLGASTINIPSDLTLSRSPQCGRRSRLRSISMWKLLTISAALFDITRFRSLFESRSPIYLKFGLRNAPDVYPSGTHLENTVTALSRERVRRAEIAMEVIARFCPEAVMSPLAAEAIAD